MNVSDSERLTQKLEDLGLKSAPEKEADLIIVNACSVRQKAVDRIWGKIKIWQEVQKKIYLTGCVLPEDQKKFIAKGIKIFQIKKLGKLLKKTSTKGWVALVPIMTGCDNFCTYCVVPFTRGREISRPMKDILKDARDALDSGSKEILLLGQNVNSYCKHSSAYNSGFTSLLEEIDKLPGNFQFNFLSSNPHDFSDKLIEALARLKKWPRELHLPLQSGDDEILRRMNRRYTSAQYLNLVKNLKLKIENLSADRQDLKLSTDIIVGFPGETKKQFENTVKLCRKIGFEKAYLAQYSPRPGTAAFKLKDNVPPKEKKRRWQILNNLINKRNGRKQMICSRP